jgi:hypothetical protein
VLRIEHRGASDVLYLIVHAMNTLDERVSFYASGFGSMSHLNLFFVLPASWSRSAALLFFEQEFREPNSGTLPGSCTKISPRA